MNLKNIDQFPFYPKFFKKLFLYMLSNYIEKFKLCLTISMVLGKDTQQPWP